MRVHVLTSVIATLASACTFSIKLEHSTDDAATEIPGDSMTVTIDAPMIDAAPPIDAGPDAMAMWVQIEVMVIPCVGTEIMSTNLLATSGTYRLRATGDCIANDEATVGGDVHGDAEYIWNQFSTNDDSADVDMGIAINDTTPDAVKLPNWGSYTTSHMYTAPWPGLGGRITAKYHDPNYNNNSGNLTLYIDSFQ